MKICELLLKNFGKFENRSIALSEGIQLLYGENESGKSTLHSFIKGMLFGMERGRGRAANHDIFTKFFSNNLQSTSPGKIPIITREE